MNHKSTFHCDFSLKRRYFSPLFLSLSLKYFWIATYLQYYEKSIFYLKKICFWCFHSLWNFIKATLFGFSSKIGSECHKKLGEKSEHSKQAMSIWNQIKLFFFASHTYSLGKISQSHSIHACFFFCISNRSG